MLRFVSCFMGMPCIGSREGEGESVSGVGAAAVAADSGRFRNVRPSMGRSASAGINHAESFRMAPGIRPSAQKSRTRRGVIPYSSANSWTVLYPSLFISTRKDIHRDVSVKRISLPYVSGPQTGSLRYQGKSTKMAFSLMSQIGWTWKGRAPGEILGNTEVIWRGRGVAIQRQGHPSSWEAARDSTEPWFC